MSTDASSPAQRTDEHAVERHATFLERTRTPIGILFLGDSITRRWVEVPDLWDDYFGRYSPANFGVGGDATQNVLWRIRNGELDRINPRVVVLLIGTNNLPTNTAPEIATAIRAIVAQIRSQLPGSCILLNTILPRGPQQPTKSHPETNPFFMDTIHEVNRDIRGLDDGAHVRVVDVGHRLIGPDGEIRSDHMPDRLHLVRPGYEVWGQALVPLIEEIMR